MSFSEVISLFIATLVFVASPGPGVFMIISSSLVNRFTHNLILSLGLITSDMVYLSVAIFGLGKIILLWHDFFFYVQLIGGLYLIFLGIKTMSSKPELYQNNKVAMSKKTTLTKQFLMGFFISFANPKTILFYLGFLPAFIDLENLHFNIALEVAIVICSAAILICLIYISASSVLKKVLSNPKQARYFNWTAGSLLMMVGLYLQYRAFEAF